jgi:hypothetical protein
MAINSSNLSNNYLNNTKSVVFAGKQLLEALDGDIETLNYAINELESAAQAQDSSGQNYRAFMFSEAETEAPKADIAREYIMEDVFASVLTDLQVGNVLLAAGQTLQGQADDAAQREHLDDALNELENTSATLESALDPTGGVASPGRFNFSEDETQPVKIKSATPEEAIKNYGQQADETLESLVKETYAVTLSVVEALKKLSPADVLESLQNLGGPIRTASNFILKLVNQGIEKIKGAIETLVSFIGNDAITQVKDKLIEFWHDIGQNNLGESLLAKLLGVDDTKENVEQTLAAEGHKIESLDDGSEALGVLVVSYKNNMAMAKKAVTAISYASIFMAFTPIGAHNAALLAGLGYCTVLATVILIGMDYTDSGRILKRVHGVGEVTNGLLTKTSAPSAQPS